MRLLAAALLLMPIAIVRRTDVPDKRYVALGASFPAVVSVGRAGDATLIADRWLITAAHVARSVGSRREIRIGTTDYSVDQVVVHLSTESEFVDATIHWKGGFTSQHEFARPVSTYARQRDFESLMSRVDELREQGQTASEIAATLNAEGFKPPKRRGEFSSPVVYQLLKRRGLMGNERSHEELVTVHRSGMSEGRGCRRRALVMASVMNSNALRPCWRHVSRMVCIVSTNRLPPAL